MEYTLSYLIYCQSPALFLIALLLLICHLVQKRRSHVRAAIDLLLAVLCVTLGILLYYLGMLREVFSIRDFWQIRVPGWIGLCVVAVASICFLCRTIKRYSDKKQAVKDANRAENARRQELETIRRQAYASGMADALAADSRNNTATSSAEVQCNTDSHEAETSGKSDQS